MSWFKNTSDQNSENSDAASSEREVGELLDPYEERTMIQEDGRAVVVPGKVLTRIRAQMERIDLDPSTSWTLEEVLNPDEMAVLFDQLRMGPMMVAETAEFARQILDRWPAQFVQHAIPPEAHLHDFINVDAVEPASEDLGRRVINRALASTQPLDQSLDIVAHPEASPQELMGAWVAVLFWFAIKSGLLHERCGPA